MNAPFVLCMERYARSVPWVNHVVTFSCQLPRDHEGGHSWAPLKDSDDLAMSPPEPVPVVAGDINDVLTAIWDGEFDPYIENLLSVCHQRKLMLRGIRTFEQPRPQPRRAP